MTTTRLNPTLNGLPHLGHAYLALTCWHAARSTGGRFLFRGEDNQTDWLKKFSQDQMREFGARWLDDLAWLGIEFDEVIYESDMDAQVVGAIQARWPGETDRGSPVPFPRVIGAEFDYYPYTRYLTAKTALLDYANGIDAVIVGVDLLPRFALYWEMVTLFGLRPVPQIFLPRLRGKGELDTVSKTNGTHKIETYRDAGWKPQEVVKLLRMSCLDDPQGDWDLDNIKPNPQIAL